MNLISRYIIRQMAVMAVYALLAFLALYSFFEIINEVGDLGKGSYNGATMAQYVLMQMPRAPTNSCPSPSSSADSSPSASLLPAAN